MYKDVDVLTAGCGAGTGVMVSPIIQNFYPGVIPVPGAEIIDPFNQNSVFYPLVAGAGALVGGFMLDRRKVSPFLIGFGITSLVSGLVRGVFLMQPSGRARAQMRSPARQIRPVARVQHRQVQPMMGSRPKGRVSPTATGISDKVIVA